MGVKSCHFKTGFTEEDLDSQNDVFPIAVNVRCYYLYGTDQCYCYLIFLAFQEFLYLSL